MVYAESTRGCGPRGTGSTPVGHLSAPSVVQCVGWHGRARRTVNPSPSGCGGSTPSWHTRTPHLRDRNGRTDLVLAQGIPVRIRAGVLGDVIDPHGSLGGRRANAATIRLPLLLSDPAVFIRAGRSWVSRGSTSIGSREAALQVRVLPPSRRGGVTVNTPLIDDLNPSSAQIAGPVGELAVPAALSARRSRVRIPPGPLVSPLVQRQHAGL